MTTLSDWVEETRDNLLAGQAPETNRLSGSIGTTDTSITLKYSPGSAQARGAIISIDLEEMKVWEWSGNTLTVERAVNGTTAASHTDLTEVEIAPRFSRFRITRALNQELDSLSSAANGLFWVDSFDITYNPAIIGYDLAGKTPSQVIAVQELRFKIAGPSAYWPPILHWDISRNMATTEFASGMAIFVNDGAYPGLPIHVRLREKFPHLSNLTDDVQTVTNLPSSANDLPPLGAAIRLSAPREIRRNFVESNSDPMMLQNIPPGAVLKSYQGLQMLRSQRIYEEAMGLLKQYGPALRTVGP